MLKILLTGGGTGGHIYPLISVAEAIKAIGKDEVKIYYLGPQSSFWSEMQEKGIVTFNLLSSKLRRYFSLENFLDIPKFFLSVFQAVFKMLLLRPDAVFSKGGPGSFAVVLAARLFLIPVMIHESDAIPGLTNLFSAKLAKRIAISFEEAASFFKRSKVALTGNPIRSDLLKEDFLGHDRAKTVLGFELSRPLILVLGGSQGSETINNFILENLRELLGISQIYHQTGKANFKEVELLARSVFENEGVGFGRSYKFVPNLSTEEIRQAFIASDLVISRAGASAIFEIAAFGKPSILIPLKTSANNHQRANAYGFSRAGAASVIEEDNLKTNLFLSELKKILGDESKASLMKNAAKSFFKPNASQTIASEVLKIAIKG